MFVHPLWLVSHNQLHLQLLEQEKSSQVTCRAVWARVWWKAVLGGICGEKAELLWALPVHCYYCYMPEKWLQKSGEDNPAGSGPFESTPNHHSQLAKGLGVTTFCKPGCPAKGHKSLPLLITVSCWWNKLGCRMSQCNHIRVPLNHRNMPKSNNSTNRNNNKHSFVCSRLRSPNALTEITKNQNYNKQRQHTY